MREPALRSVRPTGRIRLVAFDLDGTLTRGDTVSEALAQRLGYFKRILELEVMLAQHRDRDSMRRLRDDAAPHLRGVTVAELQTHLAAALTLAPGAREGFNLLRQSDVATAIITVTWEFAAAWIARELGADHYVGTGLGADGSVDHFWPEDKATWLQALIERLGVQRGEAAAVGDVPMLSVMGQALYVGPTMLPGVQARHVPNAAVHELARLITGTQRP